MSYAEQYLKRRGYAPSFLSKEGAQIIKKGSGEVLGERYDLYHDSVMFPVRSMSGELAALHYASVEEGIKDYRTLPSKNGAHLPLIYGTKDDLDLVFTSQEVIMTEGIFDRQAVKLALPEWPVVARLTKGVTGAAKVWTTRYLKRLWVLFDMDGPGTKSSERAVRAGEYDGIEVLRLQIPYKDPGEMYEKRGAADLRKSLMKQLDSMGF